jgi:hypothetical protein
MVVAANSREALRLIQRCETFRSHRGHVANLRDSRVGRRAIRRGNLNRDIDIGLFVCRGAEERRSRLNGIDVIVQMAGKRPAGRTSNDFAARVLVVVV